MAQARANLFVKIDLGNGETFAITDHYSDLVLNGVEYDAAGGLVGIGNLDFTLRATESETTLTISGIPEDNVNLIFEADFKGSPVTILRGFFDTKTGDLLPITGNPFGRFRGYVTNFDIVEEVVDGGNRVFVLNLSMTSLVSLLANKISGQRTNPIDRDRWYTGGGTGGSDGPPGPGEPGSPVEPPLPGDPFFQPTFPIPLPPNEFINVGGLENFPFNFGDVTSTRLFTSRGQLPPERGQ
jgi:hypothetical protein